MTNVHNTASQTANNQSHEMSDSDTDNNIADIDTQHDNDNNENDDTITQNVNDIVDTLVPQQQTQQTNNDDTINDIDDATNYNEIMQQSGSTFTASNYASTRLLKILDNANAPHFLYRDIMQWAVDSKAHGYQFESQCNSRPAVIENLVKHFKLQHCKPHQTTLSFPEDNLQINITRFDFVAQLFSLLTDKSLTGDITQLDVPQDNPFGMYTSPNGHLGPFNSGRWYRKAYANLCTPNSNDWLCPIIYGCDETLVGSHLGRASVTPLIFTLSIFNESLRNKRTSWRPMGYIYDLTQHGKPMMTQGRTIPRKITAEEKCSRYHQIISKIIESHIAVQRDGGIHNVTVELGNICKQNVNIKVPVAMIIGDMQGGDKHCATKIGYSINQARLCRQCNISGNESGNPLVECKRMSMTKIRQYVLNGEIDLLNSISQNNVYSAWFDCDFGGCELGIFSAAMPVEALHSVEGGLCQDVATILFEQDLKPANCGRLDILVKQFCDLDMQHYMTSGGNKAMPRMLFKDGVTSLEALTKSHIIGILLTIIAVSLTDDGKALLEEVLVPPNSNQQAGVKRLNDMRYIFSMLLCYWSWLKQPYFWKCNDKNAKKAAEASIRKMLSELIKFWPRARGNGWFKAKVHEQLHVPRDIARNGSPRNSYSGPVEHTHLTVKEQAQRTQMNRSCLDAQIGNRSAESYIINYAHDRICSISTVSDTTTVARATNSTNGSTGTVIVSRKLNGQLDIQFNWNIPNCTWAHPCQLVMDAIARWVKPLFSGPGNNQRVVKRQLVTEYNRQGIIFRAHPYYSKSGRAWYDWVMIRYVKEGNANAQDRSYFDPDDEVYYGDDVAVASNYHYAPGKILAFVRDDNDDHTDDDQLYAVVMCCAYKHSRSGVFSTYWKLEFTDTRCTKPVVLFIDVNAIVRHWCMIPENDQAHGFHEIWERERWAKEFS